MQRVDYEKYGLAFGNVDAEEMVVGGLLVDGLAWVEIDPLAFTSKPLRLIYQAMCDLRAEGDPLDMASITTKIGNKMSGAMAVMARLEEQTGTAANIGHHASVLRQCYTRRGVVERANAAMALACDVDTPIETTISEAASGFVHLLGGETKVRYDIASICTGVHSEVMQSQEGKAQGISTGYRALDAQLTAMRPGEYILVGARPSMGKTAFALNVAYKLLGAGRSVFFVSAEMSKEACVMRLASMRSHTPTPQMFKAGGMTPEQCEAFTESMAWLHEFKDKFHVYDQTALTVSRIESAIQRAQLKSKVDVVFLDYIQLLRTSKGSNETAQLSNISMDLKDMAKRLGVVLVVLSQLNRSLESRDNKRPILSDLRQSGQLEQDADVVLFLYRDEVYYPGKRGKAAERDGELEVCVAKQRSGPIGTVYLRWIAEWTLVTDGYASVSS